MKSFMASPATIERKWYVHEADYLLRLQRYCEEKINRFLHRTWIAEIM